MCTKKINIKNQVHYHYKKLIKPKKKKKLEMFYWLSRLSRMTWPCYITLIGQ